MIKNRWHCQSCIRWRDGVLEQMWQLREWSRESNEWFPTSRYEWRVVPDVKDIVDEVKFWNGDIDDAQTE